VTLADGTRHDSVGLGLTPSPSSEAASRDRDRAREGKRGVRRRIRSNEEG
jgi:hypothetical protein